MITHVRTDLDEIYQNCDDEANERASHTTRRIKKDQKRNGLRKKLSDQSTVPFNGRRRRPIHEGIPRARTLHE